uniref:Uncharacterized protein n=1 Tax=Bosea sp. NBC_00436 TaxID=2969620 RepID=A0A9E8CSZ2_9HYPH
MFTVDPSRLASIVAQSDAARISTQTANDALRRSRSDLRVAEQNLADAEHRRDRVRAEELKTFVERAREEFARAQAEHDRLSKAARNLGGVARACTDHADEAGIRIRN